jgi:hypothetical protein
MALYGANIQITSNLGGLDKGLKMAGEWGWQVVSMKNDWNDIF